jgi:hypothetical protein
VLVALHFAELLLDLQQCGCAPSLLLITRPPARDPMRLRVDAHHHTLDQVRGREADAECGEDVGAMQGERLVEALLKAARGGVTVLDARTLLAVSGVDAD